MAKRRRGPPPDSTIHRCVVRLTLKTDDPDHARVKMMLDDAPDGGKGNLVIQALLGRLDDTYEDVPDEEDFNEGWGDCIM